MANFLGGFAVAREGAFFKKEQEADLQRYVEHLKREGIISDDTGNRSPPRTVSLDHSLHNYEVLGEILQQRARLNAPQAAFLQEYEKRIKAKLPPLTEEEFHQWRSRFGLTGPMAAAMAINMRLQSNRYSSLKQVVTDSRSRAVSAEAAEAAQRQFRVAMRGLVYGSVIGGMIVSTIGTFCCMRYDIRSAEDLKLRLQTWVTPLSTSIQERVEPFKERAQRWAHSLKNQSDEGVEEPAKYETEFSKALKKKLTSSRW